MKIGITLNEVFRDTISQVQFVYEKYVGLTDIEYQDITDDDLSKFFKFKEEENFAKFIYESAAVEIFGFANQMGENLFEHTNEFLFDFYANKENKITIISKEYSRSIAATYFWLSKVNSGFRSIDLVDDYSDIWNEYDLIITATPEILLSKPENKIAIKIQAPYNKEIKADYSFENTNPLFEENGLLNKIIK